MKIEIDTSTESKEHLHHLGKMLIEMAGKKTVEENEPVATPGLFSMFNEPSSSSSSEPEPSVFNLFSEEKKEEKSDLVDNLKLVPY